MRSLSRRLLRWPLVALWVWAAAWALALALRGLHAPWWACVGAPTVMGIVAALYRPVAATRWRQGWMAAGFPLSVWVMGQSQGAEGAAGWWLLALAVLLLVYPLGAWRDAPIFPTPRGALRDLGQAAALRNPRGRVHDAGCGMGDGLLALHAAYPQAQISGVERSWLWRAVAGLRCRFARVQQGDMWADSWHDCELVYLFQRPETMPRALAKAQAEMRDGTWLVSLEFEARDARGRVVRPHISLAARGGRTVWVYRIGQRGRSDRTTLPSLSRKQS